MQSGLRGIAAPIGVGNLRYKAPLITGAIARLTDRKLRERLHVRDFGAVGDGGKDDTAAIQAGINYLKANGGGELHLDAKVYSITNLTIDGSGVALIGAVTGRIFSAGASQTGTILRARSGATTLLTVGSPSAASSTIAACRMENLVIDGNGIASKSLLVKMLTNSVFRNLVLLGSSTNQLETTCETGFAGLNYVYQCAFENICVNAGSGSAKGIVLSGEPAGASGNRTVFCMFRQIHVTHTNGTALEINDADNNSFFNLAVSRNGGGSGVGIDLIGDDADAQDLVHANLFYFCHAGPGGWRANGNKALNNWVFGLATEDGVPVAITNGAKLHYFKDDGLSNRTWALIAAFGAAATVTGTTNETTLATIPLAASTMGKNGILRVTTFWTANNSAGAKTPRVRLGGAAGTTWNPSSMSGATIAQEAVAHIINRNSESSQIGYVSGLSGLDGVAASALKTGTENTANPLDLLITGQLATGTDTLTLEAYFVESLQRE
jgi:hypothetical protein